MSPSLTSKYFSDACLVNTKYGSNISLAKRGCGPKVMDFPDTFWGEFVVRCSSSKCMPLLEFHIHVVIDYSSEPQVFRVNTCGVVSCGAVMKLAQPIRNRAIKENPAYTMGASWRTSPASEINSSVSFLGLISSPNPTAVRNCYTSPESINYAGGKSLRREKCSRQWLPVRSFGEKIHLRNQCSVGYATPRAASTAPGHLRSLSTPTHFING